MNLLLALIALAGFVLALVVHAAALGGVDVADRMPVVWALHVGVFVVFVPFVFSMRKSLGSKPKWRQLRQALPGWVLLLCLGLMAYAAVNFLVSMQDMQGGSWSIADGKYILSDHGRLIREISAAQYHALQANLLRGFSGHWLVFYFLPFVWFMFGRKRY